WSSGSSGSADGVVSFFICISNELRIALRFSDDNHGVASSSGLSEPVMCALALDQRYNSALAAKATFIGFLSI
ncbi:hypothetical protein, partial [Pelotalea chapellei]